MKHLKKLSVVLMMTTLFSVSFTSCIDNEVSPVVEAIYEAQADLIAAQAAVQNAEAALRLAEANAADAQASLLESQAAQVDAITDGILENVANSALVHEQELMTLAAETAKAVAEANMALQIAQAEFDLEMATLAAQLEAAGAQLATQYAYAYRYAMEAANYILSDKLGAEADLAEAQLMLTEGNTLSWPYVLASLEGDIATETANKAALEDAIAVLEATMADPTSMESILSQLKDEEDAIDDLIVAKNIELQEKFNEIMAIYEQNGIADDFVTRFEEAKDDLDYAISQKEAQEDIITAAQEEIADLELVLADYPAALAAATTADADATAAEAAAQTVVDDAAAALGSLIVPGPVAGDDAIDPVTTSYEELWNAQLVLADANKALADLNTALSALNTSYQDAIQELADQTALYESGLPGVTADLTAAQNAQTAAEAQLLIDQADYNAKKAAFELNPTGFVWTAGVDGVLGIQTSDAGVNDDSYVAVTVVAGAANDTYSAVSTVLPAGLEINGGTLSTLNTYAMFANDGDGLLEADDVTPYVLASNDFWNVGSDDVFGGTNADRLEAAADVLTASLAAVDAAILVVADKQAIVDNFGDDLAVAQAAYDYQKDLYENQLALVAAAEAVVDAAEDVIDAVDPQTGLLYDIAAEMNALGTEILPAAEAGNDAIEDAETFYELLWNAQLAALDAAAELATLESCDADCIQSDIDAQNDIIDEATAIIAAIQPIIDAKQAVVDSMQAEYDTYIANEGYLSSLQADLHAQIIAEWQAYWILENELDALEFQEDLKISMINAYGGWGADDLNDLADYISDLQEDIADANLAIEEAQVALALAQTEEAADEAYLEYLQALIDTLNSRYANAIAIADEYKALLDAALAS